MAVMDALVRWVTGQPVRATMPPWAAGQDNFLNNVLMDSVTYQLRQTLATSGTEHIGGSYEGYASGAYKGNGIVYSAIAARLSLLSQARFQWQRMEKGQPGDLFGTADLALLERPEPGKVTADLLTHASLDVDLAGNTFVAKRFIGGAAQLKRLRPDWVTIVLGSESNSNIDTRDIDAEVIGYIYYPGGRTSGLEPEFLLRETVAHHAPIPDPLHRFRGMSWLTPIIREIQADSAATTHKDLFFTNGATPNMVVKIDTSIPEKFRETVALINEGHTGLANAYKTLFLAAGVDAEVVGSNFQQIDFAVTQAAGEVRIAMASGVHSVILGNREGLGGSSLNQGNFMAARRLMADMTLRPWWGGFAASLEVVCPPPSGARLWYDDRHIPFLAEDVKDAAETMNRQMLTIESGVRGGFEPASIVDAVSSGDLRRLKHTGLFSVQLQPPGTTTPAPDPNAPPDMPAVMPADMPAKPAPAGKPNA